MDARTHPRIERRGEGRGGEETDRRQRRTPVGNTASQDKNMLNNTTSINLYITPKLPDTSKLLNERTRKDISEQHYAQKQKWRFDILCTY